MKKNLFKKEKKEKKKKRKGKKEKDKSISPQLLFNPLKHVLILQISNMYRLS